MTLGGFWSQVHEKVALKHILKSIKYELKGSYGDPIYKHFRSENIMISMIIKMALTWSWFQF